MKNTSKQFIAGIVVGVSVILIFGGGLFLVKKKGMPVVHKVFQKIENYRVAHIPKKKNELLLFDFEKDKELDLIQKTSCEVGLSREHATRGKLSAKVIYYANSSGASAFILKKIFDKKHNTDNWEGYDSFAFDVYNPGDKGQRVILKIKDTKGYKYEQDLHLRPKSNNKIFVSISQIRSKIKPSRINQVNLFLWKPRTQKILFVDNIRLEPARFINAKKLVILDKQYLPDEDEQIYKGGEYFNFQNKKARWSSGIPLYMNNPTDGLLKDFPVSGGIPFPQGELKSVDEIQVFDRERKPVVFQARPLGYWAGGSIKWAQIDTHLDVLPNSKQICFLSYGSKSKYNLESSKLEVKENRKQIDIVTGPLKLHIKKEAFRLFDEVFVDVNSDGQFDKNEIVSKGGDLVLVHKGKEYRSSLDRDYSLTIEEQGPLKTTIKAEGWFVSSKKKKFCKFIVRIQAFAGKDFVNVYHTFIYTGYPENKEHYLYKGKRLPKNETIEAIYIETPLELKGDMDYAFGVDNKSMKAALIKDMAIRQINDASFLVDMDNRNVFKGKRSEGWLDISGKNKGITIIEKNLWEQYPKGWEIDKRKRVVRTQLWPQWAGELDLKTTKNANGEEAVARGSAFGLAKTHLLSFYFHSGVFEKEKGWNLVKLLEKSLVLSAAPEWIYDTNAIGKIVPRLRKSKNPAEDAINLMFDWAQRQVGINKWYGMIDFGDVLSLQRDGTWLRNGRWGWFNNEAMGLVPGCLMQYLRTGDYKYFELGENNALHIMDVDTVHYNTVANDKRLRRKIDDDYSQVGSTHRHNAAHWGGRNEETSHTNLHGTLLYYYMTGYERAFDVAKEMGEFFLKEKMTYYKHPDICPQRNIANVLWGAVDMYEATQDERYKDLADKWADSLFKGQKYDGTWQETYNPQTGTWVGKEHSMFTLDYTLPALVAYHRITGNKAVAEAIVNGTRYYVDKKPYNPFFEASVYSYYLTGDSIFLNSAFERCDYYVKHQRRSDDPLINGMIYQKAYYARPVEFLYQLPFVFEAFKFKSL